MNRKIGDDRNRIPVVSHGGQMAFRFEMDGVTVRRVNAANDPVIERFLTFLVCDLEHRPEAVAALSPNLAVRLQALTAGGAVDVAAPIDGDVAL